MSEKDLPPGWAWAELKDLGSWYGGGTPSKANVEFWTDGDVPWLSPKDMGNEVLAGTQDHVTAAAVAGSAAKLVPSGSVAVVVRSGILERTFPVALVPFATTLNQDMKAVLPHRGIEARWLAHALRGREREILGSCRRAGTTVASIESASFQRLRLAVPPTAEQQRIVAEVDRRLSHIDATERSLRRCHALSNQARVAVLRAAVTGALVPTLDGDDSLAVELEAQDLAFREVEGRPGWVRVRIDTIAKVGSGATPKRGEKRYWEDGTIPWVTSGQVVSGKVREASAHITEAALAETSVKLWPAGTLLVAMYGEGRTRGHCAELMLDATCNQACAAIQLMPGFADLKDYLHLVLDAGYEQNRVLGSGGVQENLSLGLVRGIEVDIPPARTRRRIMQEASRRLSLLAASQDKVRQQLAHCEQLRRTVLNAAFSGRLVEQRPDEEPAQRLLERIAADRAANPTPKRSRTARTSKEKSA